MLQGPEARTQGCMQSLMDQLKHASRAQAAHKSTERNLSPNTHGHAKVMPPPKYGGPSCLLEPWHDSHTYTSVSSVNAIVL